MKHLFPIIIIILMMIAAVVYGVQKDVGRALYWFSGAIINITANFLID